VTTDERQLRLHRSRRKIRDPARYDSAAPNNETSRGSVVNASPRRSEGRWGFIDKQRVTSAHLSVTRAFATAFAEVQIKTGSAHVRPDGTAIDFQPDEVDEAKLPDRPCGAPLATPAVK